MYFYTLPTHILLVEIKRKYLNVMHIGKYSKFDPEAILI